MSTTKKKTQQTNKNTGSRSTKQSQSSKTRSSKLKVTTTPRKKKSDSMQNHDYENRTELTTKQLKSFVPISEAEHNKFAKIDTIHVLKNGVVVETRKVGRPKKDVAQKENVVSIRLSAFFIQKLKEKAMHEGNLGWQTYIKKVLEQHLNAG